MKKKLCYVLPEYDPLTVDHYYHIYELLEDVAHHLDVCLVVEKAKGHPDFKGIKNIFTLKLKGIPLNLVERLFVFTYIRLKGYKRFYVHYSYSSAIAASLVTRLMGGRTLYWHSGLKKDFMVKWKWNLEVIKKKLFDDYAFLLTLRLIDYLVTSTEFMKGYFWTNFGVSKERIKVMPNWVNLERFDAGKYDRERIRQEFSLDTNTKVVLFVHWLSPRKGPQYLVRIAGEVIRSFSDVVFLIVGEGPYKETLKHEIEEKGLEGVMKLVGGVPNKEIARYYAIADLFIMPSEQEGFGRVLLEAMGMGLPFVAPDVGSVKEIVGEKLTNCIVRKMDVSIFSRKVIEILKDDGLREVLKREGLERVKYFDKNTTVSRFVSIIEGVRD